MIRLARSVVRPRGFAAALLLSCFAVPVAAQGMQGTVSTIQGDRLTGNVTIAADGTVTVASDVANETFAIDELLLFEHAGVEPRKVRSQHRVWLRSGLELPAKKIVGVAGANGTASLRVTLPSNVRLDLPISTVSAIRHGGTLRPEPALFASDLSLPPANNDLIYVVRGGKTQRSSVTVTGFTEDTVDFELRGDAYEFELKGLCAVVFGKNTGFAPDRQSSPRSQVTLSTGEVLHGKLQGVDETLKLRLDEGCVVDVATSRVVKIEVASDRLVWLTQLEPKVEQTPAFDRVWPWHRDGNRRRSRLPACWADDAARHRPRAVHAAHLRPRRSLRRLRGTDWYR